MHLHEHQAKVLLKQFGIPVPDFAVISQLNELSNALEKLKSEKVALKAQVHAGGRGKAGGVKLAKNRQEAEISAKQLLGMKMSTAQTGGHEILVSQILITPLVDIKKEFYLAAAIDREQAQAVLIASPEGGVDIETLAAENPEKILKVIIPLDGHLPSYRLLEIAKFMSWTGDAAQEGMQICKGLAKAFMDLDASLIEINPLVLDGKGHLLALDAKISLDENALFRHQDLLQYDDPSQLPPLEAEAKKIELSYIALDGNIGCVVNGAGLAMATMDIIDHYKGKPANFLDVGGSATQEKITEGFKIILSDPKVKSILVNIFGGIMNCATLAAGMIAAANELQVSTPLIVRMEGTNVEEAKEMLAASGLIVEIADSMADAAKKAVLAAK